MDHNANALKIMEEFAEEFYQVFPSDEEPLTFNYGHGAITVTCLNDTNHKDFVDRIVAAGRWKQHDPKGALRRGFYLLSCSYEC